MKVAFLKPKALMKEPNIKSEAAESLRRKAIKLLKTRHSESGPELSEANALKLVHELEVYQIELEMQNDELSKLNTEKDKFFSILAHDLRGPFGSFLGLTKILAEELPEMKQKEIIEIADSLRESATNIYYLLENLLDWSRMQRGLIEFNPEKAAFAEVINSSIESLSNLARIKKQEILLQVPENLFVKTDVFMLETILRNLILNAIKYSYPGGKIHISARALQNKLVEIAIEDSGTGIDDELMSKLFSLNGQKGEVGTEGEPSTGLGLLICKEFIEKIGGKIRAESTVGKGSTFIFTLPLN